MMIEVGSIVKVLEPFANDFPDVYIVEEIIIHDDGQVTYLLGTAGGFDIKFLEEISGDNNS